MCVRAVYASGSGHNTRERASCDGKQHDEEEEKKKHTYLNNGSTCWLVELVLGVVEKAFSLGWNWMSVTSTPARYYYHHHNHHYHEPCLRLSTISPPIPSTTRLHYTSVPFPKVDANDIFLNKFLCPPKNGKVMLVLTVFFPCQRCCCGCFFSFVVHAHVTKWFPKALPRDFSFQRAPLKGLIYKHVVNAIAIFCIFPSHCKTFSFVFLFISLRGWMALVWLRIDSSKFNEYFFLPSSLLFVVDAVMYLYLPFCRILCLTVRPKRALDGGRGLEWLSI